jgi:hypothetical protein
VILLAAALLGGPAWAGSLIVSIGPETLIDVDRSGNWGRVYPAEDGVSWDLFIASGGDYLRYPMDADFVPDLTRGQALTGRTDLVDHSITRCPDGSWLHVSSSTTLLPDDTAWAFRYDADFTRTAEVQLYAAEPTQVHRDMPLLCTETFAATGFFDPENRLPFRLVELDDAAQPVRVDEPDFGAVATGSVLMDLDGALGIASFPGVEVDYLHVSEFSLPGLDLIDRHLQDVSPPGEKAYWSQGFARVGDRYVLAYMSRDETAGFASHDGNVWLGVFNLDWRLIERVPITTNVAPLGGMQPWITFRDDTIVLTYTKDLRTYRYDIVVDRVEAGLDPAPEAGARRAADTSDVSVDTWADSRGGCGGAALLLMAPVGLLGRRRRG